MQPQDMPHHLTTTWRTFMGEERVFTVQQSAVMEVSEGQRFFLITLHHASGVIPAGVGLSIAEQDACRLAARLFGEAQENLAEADITDACGELSNVFASGVTSHVGAYADLELGLPVSLSAEQFHQTLLGSAIRQCYLASHMQVIVFDPLVQPQAAWPAAMS